MLRSHLESEAGMTKPRQRKPRNPRLPPPWVRRADWKRTGQNVVFAFPHLHHDEDRETAELGRLWNYAETHPQCLDAWMRKVDGARTPACACPQCQLERNHV
jgi:hypothetical protein